VLVGGAIVAGSNSVSAASSSALQNEFAAKPAARSDRKASLKAADDARKDQVASQVKEKYRNIAHAKQKKLNDEVIVQNAVE